MQRFPPAEDGPLFELESIGRTLGDLEPGEIVAPRPGGVIAPVVWSFIATLALIGFISWLLVG